MLYLAVIKTTLSVMNIGVPESSEAELFAMD